MGEGTWVQSASPGLCRGSKHVHENTMGDPASPHGALSLYDTVCGFPGEFRASAMSIGRGGPIDRSEQVEAFNQVCHRPQPSHERCRMTWVARPNTLPLVGLGSHRVEGHP